MSAALLPRLAVFDERVLSALATTRGQRAARISALLDGAPGYRCEDCGRETRVGGVSARKRLVWEQRRTMPCPEWADGCGGRERPVLLATAEQIREVREILRGLEHIGLARCAGGWWRRV